jgi:hypothetical protein
LILTSKQKPCKIEGAVTVLHGLSKDAWDGGGTPFRGFFAACFPVLRIPGGLVSLPGISRGRLYHNSCFVTSQQQIVTKHDVCDKGQKPFFFQEGF